ncbi:MAG: S-layer homology domain-containing protein [Chloroflexota bacterium]|nr:S-layer homology domain-containing protein [Chloroflexota bacterium]
MNAAQSQYGGGPSDAFVTALSFAGNTLNYSTYLGGSGTDAGLGIDTLRIDDTQFSDYYAYIAGYTDSANFPVVGGPLQPALAGGTDAFFSIIDPRTPAPTPTPVVTPPTSSRTNTPSSTPQVATPSATRSAVPPTLTARPPTGTQVPPTQAGTPPPSIIATSTGTPAMPSASVTRPRPTSTFTVTATAPSASATPMVTVTACNLQFTDVPSTNTFYAYVRCLACSGIISGYTCGGTNPLTGEPEPCEGDNPYFRYNNPVTRGQISKLVANSAGFGEDPGSQLFEDTPVGSPFYPFINRLLNRSVMAGYSCGTRRDEPCIGPINRPYFRPSANASRRQLSKIVSNAAGFSEVQTEQSFEDVGTGDLFYLFIQRLFIRNVMGGYACGGVNPENGQAEPCRPGNRPYFRPADTVTRGQSAKIVAGTFFQGCQTSAR